MFAFNSILFPIFLLIETALSLLALMTLFWLRLSSIPILPAHTAMLSVDVCESHLPTKKFCKLQERYRRKDSKNNVMIVRYRFKERKPGVGALAELPRPACNALTRRSVLSPAVVAPVGDAETPPPLHAHIP